MISKAKVKLPSVEVSEEHHVSVKEMKAIRKFFGDVIPSFIKDGVGILDDNVKFFRWKNALQIVTEAEKLKASLKLETHPLPLKLGVPLLEAASLEDNPEIQKRWINLLVNASSNSEMIPKKFIDTLEQLTPKDVFVLDKLYDYVIEENKLTSSGNPVTPWLFPFDSGFLHGGESGWPSGSYLESEFVVSRLLELGIIRDIKASYLDELDRETISSYLPDLGTEPFEEIAKFTTYMTFTVFGYFFITTCRPPIAEK